MEEKKFCLSFLILAKHRKPVERRAGLCGALPELCGHISSAGLGVSLAAWSWIMAETLTSAAPGHSTPGPRGGKPKLVEMCPPGG